MTATTIRLVWSLTSSSPNRLSIADGLCKHRQGAVRPRQEGAIATPKPKNAGRQWHSYRPNPAFSANLGAQERPATVDK